MAEPVLRLERIEKAYRIGDGEFLALKGVSFDLHEGEMVALMGPSGSGKSTLMNIIGILDRPSAGRYLLRGEVVGGFGEIDRAELRNEYIGFVFQSFHLLPRLNLLENVEVPLIYAGYAPAVRRERAFDMLEKVGLADKWRNLPSQISGGQKQRAAVARALAMNPALLLADEPTGNLDTHTGNEILALFRALNAEGVTVLIVTHEHEIAEQTRRSIRLRDGLLESDERHEPRRPDPAFAAPVGGTP
jgi:putative ABC transport system ATP-binding protein